jgi:uncharacterized protein (DUF488 family)
MMIEFVTIGVYGFDAERFFQALIDAHVDTLCDIRRRRGVRGAEYAFANSRRLQERLAVLKIRYLHRIDLAPADDLREQQAKVDEQTHTARRQRKLLSDQFVTGYRDTVLAGFDGPRFVADLAPTAHVVALLCVEREPAACHRSLLADYLHTTLGVAVRHLTP